MLPWCLLDILLVAFHTALILFNLLGWLHPRTRRLNLFTLLLTGLSWTLLGLFYGFGYCPFTDWHFMVLDRLGTPTPFTSYIPYFLDRMLGVRVSDGLADRLTLWCYLAALACSVSVNFLFKKRARPSG